MKKYRFFYHYNKWTGGMTVHYKKQCLTVNDVICNVPCESKWNKSQPKLVMQGWATSLNIINGKAYIQ